MEKSDHHSLGKSQRLYKVLGLTMGLCLQPYALAQNPPEVNNSAPAQQPKEKKRLNEVVTVFEDRGILTSKGTFVLEPSISYAHTSSRIVAIEGFTVIPALVVGLINVSEIQRDILNYSLSLRYGVTNRMEIGFKVPYIQIEESIRERAAFKGTPVDVINDSKGDGLGDIEMSLNYQLNDGLNGFPYFVSNFRVKSKTGISPFEIKKRQLKSSDDTVVGTIYEEQPTGSGFWSIQGGLTSMYPSDPAVLYGSASYTWNIKEDKGPEYGYTIDPGDLVEFGFGIGFSVNERTSFSLGYNHIVLFDTTTEAQQSATEAVFDRVHSGSLLLGVSQSTGKESSLNLSLSVGVTEAAPDMQLTLRTPIIFH